MEWSAMIMQTACQNALYINPKEYSSILIIYHYKSYWIIFTLYTEKMFDNNVWNFEHMAMVNVTGMWA